MKRYGFGLFVVAGMLMLSALLGQACVLDTYGTLFADGGADAGPDCNALCEEAAAGSSGNAGTAGQGTPDVDVPDTCDCGDAGSGGSAGAGGTGGSAGTGGATGGTGGSAGQGGATGGTGGSAGSGGEAGQGGTGGAAGGGGQAGQGGAGGSGPTCVVAGDDGTINKITAEAIRVYLHYADDSETFLSYSPVNFSFDTKPLSAQAVVLGSNGLSFGLWHDSTPTPTVLYTIDEATLPAAECTGVDIRSIECSRILAKSFRCQFPPYNEVVGCPANVAFTAQLASDSYADPSGGYQMVLADIYCP